MKRYEGYAGRILFDGFKGPFFSVPFLWAIKEKGPGAQGRSAREFEFDFDVSVKAVGK